jgi:hypothetical protein
VLSIPSEFAYSALAAALLMVWGVLYALNPGGRRAQIRASLLFLMFIPFEFFYLTDYWRPAKHPSIQLFSGYLGLEDLVFAFSFGGIVAAIVSIFDRKYNHGGWSRAAWVALGTFLVSLALWWAGINSIIAASIAALLAVLAFTFRDAELIRRASIGGLAAGLLMFTTYMAGFLLSANTEAILATIWLLYDAPLGERLAGVPVTELIWALAFGALVAIL